MLTEVVVAVADVVATDDVAAAAIPVEKAGSLICIIDWKAHLTPVSVVSFVNATVLLELSKR